MADNSTWSREQTSRVRTDNATQGARGRVPAPLTRDTRDAYRYYTNTVDREALASCPGGSGSSSLPAALPGPHDEDVARPPRAVRRGRSEPAAVGLAMMIEGVHAVWIPLTRSFSGSRCRPPNGPPGRPAPASIAWLALPIVLEVFERLSLKNDLEIARDIQQAMLPRGLDSRRPRRVRHHARGQHGRRRFLRHPAPPTAGWSSRWAMSRARAARRRC